MRDAPGAEDRLRPNVGPSSSLQGRSGVGRAAAFKLFAQWPDAWQIAVLRRNVGAAKFWRSILRQLSSTSEMREIDVRSADWDGPIFMFGMGEMTAKPTERSQSSPSGSLTLGEMIAWELDSKLLTT